MASSTDVAVTEHSIREPGATVVVCSMVVAVGIDPEEEVECELNLANVEIMQILPLRMKLTESNKKIDALRGELLAANNENADHGSDKLQMVIQLEISSQRIEDSNKTLGDLQEQYASCKQEISG